LNAVIVGIRYIQKCHLTFGAQGETLGRLKLAGRSSFAAPFLDKGLIGVKSLYSVIAGFSHIKVFFEKIESLGRIDLTVGGPNTGKGNLIGARRAETVQRLYLEITNINIIAREGN